MREKRKHERLAVGFPMGWALSEGDARIAATCRDISLGGCFLETAQPPPIGTPIVVHLELPSATASGPRPPAAVVRSTVRWSTPGGMGIQLGPMGAHATADLVAFLSRALPAEGSARKPRIAEEERPGFLHDPRFPRSNAYNPQWVLDGELRAHPLWLTEWLIGKMGLRSGMRVLDLGSTKARTGVFLARELGVEVWAADPSASPTENRRRAVDAGCGDRLFPIRVDPRRLPFAEGFFDAIVCVDVSDRAGMAEVDPVELARLVKPGGEIGFASAGLTCDMRMTIPAHVARFVGDGAPGLHLVERWRSRLTRAGGIERADTGRIEEGCASWLTWAEATHRPDAYLHTLRAYGARYLGFFGLVARRAVDAPAVGPSPASVGSTTAPASAPLLRARGEAAA